MKKPFFFSYLSLLILLWGFSFPGCQAIESSDSPSADKSLQAMILKTGDYLVDSDSCHGMRSYGISYLILDSSEFLGHSVAIQILAGPPTNLDSCNCDSLVYCVTLSFPIQQVTNAGFKNQNAPYQPTPLVKNGLGGYYNHTDPRQPPGYYPTHIMCAAQDSNRVAYFDLVPGFPNGYNLADAIIEVEGICIVDNLEDTQTDDDGGNGNGGNGGGGNGGGG